MCKVFVTGLGVISAIGDNVETNHRALINGNCGLSDLENFQTIYSNSFRFGEVKMDDQAFKKLHKLTDPGVSRTSLLAFHAMMEAIEDSGLTRQELASYQTGLITSNSIGGMCFTDAFYQDANATSNSIGSPYLNSYDFCSVTLFLQSKFGIKGVCNTINTACSSAANAIMFGARLIKNGLANRVIVGGADSLAKITINGFNALGILASQNCRPFDKDRNGLNLGEGAGFLVLENESLVGNKKVYAELSGFGNSNDAFHASSLSETGEGPFLAMSGALKTAKIESNKIDFVNTHGTGTENNDLVESLAMLRIFERVPHFVSSKSKIGHTLGAAGAIEAVYTILALYYQEYFTSLNFSNPIDATGLIPNLTYHKDKINHVMSNSFGFGGNCSSLIFSKV